MIMAKVAFGRLLNRFAGCRIHDRQAAFVVDLYHLNVLIGATVRTGRAADTGLIVDRHAASQFIATDSARRAADHANGVDTVHTSVGDHPMVVDFALSIESWVIVVGRRTGTNAIVTSRTAIEIDYHGVGAVDEPILNQEFKQPRIG